MRAHEIVEEYPVVGLDDDALQAARLLVERRLPGLIVTDAQGQPHTVLPGSQVLRFVIPTYVQEDPSLARVFDERHADRLCETLIGRSVREVLPKKRIELPVVDADSTAVEIAAVMARMHSPVVAVVEGARLLGAVTVSRLLGLLIAGVEKST